jgi:hypothetical protein
MAHHGPLWTQSGSYPAQADRSLLGALWPAGGVRGGAVTAVLNTPTTSVAPGSAAVPLQSGQGSALCTWDTAEVIDHSPAPASGTSRIDLIVCQVRDPDLDGGANSDFILTLVKGQPAMMAEARPGEDDDEGPVVEPFAGVAPAVPANALAIAQVTVPGGAANLNGATITAVVTSQLAVPPLGLQVRAGSLVQNTGATGNIDNIPFTPGPFPNACTAVLVSGIEPVPQVTVVWPQVTKSHFAVVCRLNNGSAVVGQSVGITWAAFGN